MKHWLLDKLGTLLVLSGSLGLGYYIGKFQLFTSLDPSTLLPIQHTQLGGSLLILIVGLIFRFYDIKSWKSEKQELAGIVVDEERSRTEADNLLHEAKQRNKDLTNEIHELEDQIEDVERILNASIDRHMKLELPRYIKEHVEAYLAEREAQKND